MPMLPPLPNLSGGSEAVGLASWPAAPSVPVRPSADTRSDRCVFVLVRQPPFGIRYANPVVRHSQLGRCSLGS
jgi:hypothetical protein